MRKELKSVLLSLLLPGLGHLYLKKIFDGVFIAGVTIFVWIILFYLIQSMDIFEGRPLIITLGLFILYAYATIDAYLKAGKQK